MAEKKQPTQAEIEAYWQAHKNDPVTLDELQEILAPLGAQMRAYVDQTVGKASLRGSTKKTDAKKSRDPDRLKRNLEEARARGVARLKAEGRDPDMPASAADLEQLAEFVWKHSELIHWLADRLDDHDFNFGVLGDLKKRLESAIKGAARAKK